MYKKMFLICKVIQYRFIAVSFLITALLLDTLYVTEHLNSLIAVVFILFNVFIIYHQITKKKFDRSIEDMKSDADIDSDEEFDEILTDASKIDMLTYVSDEYLFNFGKCEAICLDDIKSADKSQESHEASTHSGRNIKTLFTLTITDISGERHKLSFRSAYRLELAYSKIMRNGTAIDESQFASDIKAERTQIIEMIISIVIFLAMIIFIKI
ncbi:MAG: hypothetical protein MJ100_03285 [Ruminococcus sp.]|nr:hypothetical protein [Ruminococcus sp.]